MAVIRTASRAVIRLVVRCVVPGRVSAVLCVVLGLWGHSVSAAPDEEPSVAALGTRLRVPTAPPRFDPEVWRDRTAEQRISARPLALAPWGSGMALVYDMAEPFRGRRSAWIQLLDYRGAPRGDSLDLLTWPPGRSRPHWARPSGDGVVVIWGPGLATHLTPDHRRQRPVEADGWIEELIGPVYGARREADITWLITGDGEPDRLQWFTEGSALPREALLGEGAEMSPPARAARIEAVSEGRFVVLSNGAGEIRWSRFEPRDAGFCPWDQPDAVVQAVAGVVRAPSGPALLYLAGQTWRLRPFPEEGEPPPPETPLTCADLQKAGWAPLTRSDPWASAICGASGPLGPPPMGPATWLDTPEGRWVVWAASADERCRQQCDVDLWMARRDPDGQWRLPVRNLTRFKGRIR